MGNHVRGKHNDICHGDVLLSEDDANETVTLCAPGKRVGVLYDINKKTKNAFSKSPFSVIIANNHKLLFYDGPF